MSAGISATQRGVLRGISIAAGLTLVCVAGAAVWRPAGLVPADELAARLAFVAQWDLLVVVWILVGVGSLARQRFFNAEDIDGGGLTAGSSKTRILQSVLQNSMEQAILAVFIHSTWAVLLPSLWLAPIPAAALLFFVGRILFWRGYGKGAPGRALGFGLTFYPSVLMFVILAGIVLARLGGW